MSCEWFTADGVMTERLVNHGDGTGTRTFFAADGTVTDEVTVTDLPIPADPDPDPVAVLQAQVAELQAVIDALLGGD